MVEMRHLNQYLKSRNGRWHYVRRVPATYQEVDPRVVIRASLKTGSVEVARVRRDAMAEADELYWASLAGRKSDNPAKSNPAIARYQAAQKRAMARGFVYTPVEELAASSPVDEILTRLSEIVRHPKEEKQEAEALLGTVKPKSITVSQAFDVYCRDISTSTLIGKSPEQKDNWRKVKQRAVNNFIATCGDLEMDKITRAHAKEFRNWWGDRLKPKGDKKGLHPNSANRDIGNLSNLFELYWDYEGNDNIENPFRNLRFKNVVYKDVPPFPVEWVREKILKPGVFDGINAEALLIIYALIETGCRPSEIANIEPQHIKLDANVPHLQLRNTDKRKLKSKSSVRDIPLVGISLEAMRRAPNGFPRYRNNGNGLSNLLMKEFRTRELFPTADHNIYSFRHAFEDRMTEAHLDYGLRCILMGHHNSRPSYGTGGSLEYKAAEVGKIEFPISQQLVGALPSV